jgi:predicted AlkP superfamily phosphohydrolase/phosphomutase
LNAVRYRNLPQSNEVFTSQKREQAMQRIMVVGWDGADWRILEPMLRDGRLPVLQRLIAEGVSGPLRSTIPTHSYTAWASFMTGKNPGKHGIYTFGRYIPTQSVQSMPADRLSIVGETFFEILSRHGRKVGTAHIPLSFPPAVVDGFWVSGMVIPKGASYTYPADLQSILETHTGTSFADRVGWAMLENEWEQVFDRTEVITQAQIQGLFYLLDHQAWDVFTYVFVSPDRLQHISMRLLDESHPDYDVELSQHYLPRIYEHFELLDMTLGKILKRVGKDTLLLLVSDHGFRSCWCGWSAEAWLRERNYLKFRRNWPELQRLLQIMIRIIARSPDQRRMLLRKWTRRLIGGVDWSCTRAYVASPLEQGIRINLQGREPFGIVPLSEYEQLREHLRAEIRALRDPDTGQLLVSEVYLREELYQGLKVEEAPDLVFNFAPGVAVPKKSPERGHYITPTGWKSGEHDLDGILVAYGPHVAAGRRLEHARLIDIAPTILQIMDVPILEDMDGTFLADLFYDAAIAPVRRETSQAYQAEASVYTPEEEEQMKEYLRSLGYHG